MDILMGLVSASPTLIVDLIAIIMGIVHLSKYKFPAFLTLIGGMLNLFTTISWQVIFHLLLFNSQTLDSVEGRGTWLSVLSLSTSVVHAIAWSMIVFAVFAGRKQAARDDKGRSR